MRSPHRLDGMTTLAGVQRASLSAAFCTRLRSTLEDGEAAVNRLIRTYDSDVADHHLAVSRIAFRLAEGLRLGPDAAKGIELASSIHDIGQIGVTGSDGTDIRTAPVDPLAIHPRAGASIVEGIRFPWPIAVMILQHHERMDGSGYPDGVTARSIHVGARVIAVADVVATRSDQVRTLGAALDLLEAGRGSLFDAAVTDVCLALFPRASLTVVPMTTAGS